MRLFISMIIVVLLGCPVSVHAAGDWCFTQECHDDAEEDEQQTLEFLLGVIVVVGVYAIISSTISADQKEAELMSKWVAQFSKSKPHE